MIVREFSRLAFSFLVIMVLQVLFVTAFAEVSGVIPQSQMSVVSWDSQEMVGEDGRATNVLDGDPGTLWHTEWLNQNPPPPHEIVVDLGGEYDVSEFRYLPRSEVWGNGRIKDYQFYVSDTVSNWGTVAATGAFPNTAAEQSVTLPTVRRGRYVRLVAVSEVNGNPWTSVAEFNVVGAAVSGSNLAPNGVIDTPVSNALIMVGQGVNFAATGSDPDGNTPLSYSWDFDGGASNSTQEDPGAVVFSTPGVYTVTLTVADSLGLADATPASVQVMVSLPGSGVIPQSQMSVVSWDSQETVGEDGRATNVLDGDPGTLWHTEWLNQNPPPPHEIVVDLGGEYDVSEFRYLPRSEVWGNGRIKDYQFYVSDTVSNWGTVAATGAFPNTAAEQSVTLPTVRRGRYVRLVAVSEVNGNPWTSVAEFNVVGAAVSGSNLAPNGVIDTPVSNALIMVGQGVNFAATGSDPDGNTPLSYSWDFDGGASNSTQEDPGAVVFSTPGVYTVTLTVADSLGLADATPASVQVMVSLPGSGVIPQSQMSVVSWDSQETVGEDGRATNVLDGDPGTLWHTEWLNQNPPPPHEIVVDLGGEYDVSEFRYLPRSEVWGNGRIKDYQFYVSDTVSNWGTVAATGAFPNTAAEQSVTLPTVRRGRYVRLVAVSEVNGNPWTSVAEFNVVGAAVSGSNLAPNGVIDTPVSNALIMVGQGVNFAATGSDPDGNTPLSYSWDFDGGASNSTQEDPGAVVFSTPGVYTVTLTVADSLGLADPTPASVQVTVNVTPPVSGVIPQSGMTMVFWDSQETVGEDGRATNVLDGNPDTFWHTEWLNQNPPPPHEIVVNLGALFEVDGFRFLPRQDFGLNGRINEYEFYVSLDGTDWGLPVVAGSFENDSLEKEVLFTRTTAQFVRLVALNEVNGNPWTSIAEFNVIGVPFSGNYAPNGDIDSPTSNTVVTVGASLNFSATGSDLDGNTPLNYSWDFGGGASNSTQEDPGAVVFNTVGTYVVRQTVTDALGREDESPATVVVKVEPATGNDTTIIQSAWSLVSVDSQESTATAGAKAFDGDTATYWKSATTAFPHEIIIDMGSIYAVDRFRYYPRQDGSSSGRVGQYRIYDSDDGQTWGPPSATGSFANSTSEKSVLFAPEFGRFIRFVALSAASGGSAASAGEINVEGVCNVPYVRLLAPQTDDVQSQPGLSARATVCLNPVTHFGWGVRFKLDGSTSVVDDVAPFEVDFAVAGPGNHTIEAAIVDQADDPVGGSYTVDISTNVGVGDYFVAIGDSITEGIGDDIVSDNVSADGRNHNRGFAPILVDALSTAYPAFIAMEGISGYTSAQGLARLPMVLDKHPEAQFYLMLYGTNDSGGAFPVPSGLGLSPGNAGYVGSLKAILQDMIDLITSHAGGGKEAYLAKVPFTLIGSRNTVIQQYNLVIDELVASNSIAVTPPDFYSHFQANQNQMSDSLHPDGVGYQSMSTLWSNVLP